MYLKNISLINFKNYEQVDLEFSPKINCFVGNNGVGKTNLLDAIYYLSLTKSFFNSIDNQNINHTKDFFVIQGNYIRSEKVENIYCGVKRNKRKQFKRNKKEYHRLSEHIGLIPVVMISPADSSIITEGSEERRKFINGVISQYDNQYLDDIINYNRALSQRNKLLKDFAKNNNFDTETLEIWNEQLILPGKRIYQKRVEFINKLVPIFQKYYNYVSLGNEKVELIYESQLYSTNFKNLLKESVLKDRILQYTSVGIHKDDLFLKLEGYSIKKTGSQGQQKTFLVAIKLAKFDFIKELNGFKPVLLLDDIFDKFDTQRRKQIIKLLADNNFGQIFITETSKDRLESILADIKIDFRLFKIKDGVIEN